MATQKHKCVNFGSCLVADSMTERDAGTGVVDPICEECGQPLTPVSGGAGGGRGGVGKGFVAGGTLIAAGVLSFAAWRMLAGSPAPLIVSDLSPVAQTNAQFTYQIQVKGSVDRYQAANLPTGLTLDPIKGTIVGSVKKPGTYEVVVSAVKGGKSDRKTIKLVVDGPAPKPPTRVDPPVVVTPPPTQPAPATAPAVAAANRLRVSEALGYSASVLASLASYEERVELLKNNPTPGQSSLAEYESLAARSRSTMAQQISLVKSTQPGGSGAMIDELLAELPRKSKGLDTATRASNFLAKHWKELCETDSVEAKLGEIRMDLIREVAQTRK